MFHILAQRSEMIAAGRNAVKAGQAAEGGIQRLGRKAEAQHAHGGAGEDCEAPQVSLPTHPLGMRDDEAHAGEREETARD